MKIYLCQKKRCYFEQLLNFATKFDDKKIKAEFVPELINKKTDSKQSSVSWESWSDDEMRIMHKHCGELMNRFGYGTEEKWKTIIDHQ